VKVIVDAQLPKRLSDYLASKQVDARHTLELSKKNAMKSVRERLNQLR